MTLLVALPLGLTFGCNPFTKPPAPVGTSARELPNAQIAPNTAGVDIFYIRVPYQDREILQDFWRATDEQIPGIDSRELHANGIRVGIQGAGMSLPLSKLLDLKVPEINAREQELTREIAADSQTTEQLVSRQFQQLVPGKIAYLQPYADEISKVSRFWLENGKLVGKTYDNVNAYISITATPLGEREGGVLFNVVPVMHYGDAVLKFASVHGYYAKEMKRPRVGFDHLAVSVKLLPGQWLLIGPTSERPAGIGHYFFTREMGDTEQKILAIRLSMVQNDGYR